MFSLEGPARTPRQNRLLAAWLSGVAGFVNSAGFVLLGAFTSHVTGSAGRFADDVVKRDAPAATGALLLVLSFFLGAVAANGVLLGRSPGKRGRAYLGLLLGEAAVLGAVAVLADLRAGPGERIDVLAAMLCFAMGLQNSLVTLISDARVRTTHLSGVVTDLGIEAARWLRWVFRREGASERPASTTAVLLLTVLFGFLGGAVAGSESTVLFGPRALWAPAVLLGVLVGWTARNQRNGT